MRCGYHYLNREGNLLDYTKCNEPSAQIHAGMKAGRLHIVQDEYSDIGIPKYHKEKDREKNECD